jgi:hypothetical protein
VPEALLSRTATTGQKRYDKYIAQGKTGYMSAVTVAVAVAVAAAVPVAVAVAHARR